MKLLNNQNTELHYKNAEKISLLLFGICLVFVPGILQAEPANYKSGISVTFGGTQGIDWQEELFWYNPIQDDYKVVFIKSTTQISMYHNELNERQTDGGLHITIGADGGGQIRYCIDRDWQLKHFWGEPRGTEDIRYPAYNAPFSFSQLTYGTGYTDDNSTVPVVGSTGHNGKGIVINSQTGQITITDRALHYQYGQVDEFGDEWHQMALADDDTAIREAVGLTFNENHSSDSKLILFVVNPKTPCIRFSATGAGQFYTTPPKSYQVPKIHSQTTYVSNGVSFTLSNVTNSNPCYYRFGTTGNYVQYQTPVSLDSLPDGEHTLYYYYNSNYIKTRKIVKNPQYPSAGETHGYLLWEDDAKFEKIRHLIKEDTTSSHYYTYNRPDDVGRNYRRRADYPENFDDNMGKGTRAKYEKAFRNALIAKIEGFTNETVEDSQSGKGCALRAKNLLLDNALAVANFGVIIGNGQPNPSIVLWRRGYYDVTIYLDQVAAYDILISGFKASDVSGGITPIEDCKIRDTLAKVAHLASMEVGEYSVYQYTTGTSGMWATAREIAAYVIAIAMPSYNSCYYGTSGFDGTPAEYTWTPYPNQSVSWKELLHLETRVDGSPLQYLGFPNLAHEFGINGMFLSSPTVRSDDGKILPVGSWHDRIPYAAFSLQGYLFPIIANITEISPYTRGRYFPSMKEHFILSIEGDLYGFKVSGSGDLEPLQLVQRGLINSRFPDLAPLAEATVTDTTFILSDYDLAFYDPEWNEDSPQDPTATLTITASNGSVTRSPSKTYYTAGEIVTLTAVPNSGYAFSGWSGDVSGTANPVNITMNSNKSVTAAFTQIPGTTYTLTVTAPNGSVTKSPNQTSYAAGTTVTLTALPNAGYTFSAWSGDTSGSSNPVAVSMNSNKSITANFAQQVTNDNFANAIAITGLSGQRTGSNTGATKETGEPSHAGYVGGSSLWWYWTAPASGQATINTLGSAFDTLLGVYTGSSVANLTTITSNDDSSSGVTQSQVTFNAISGTIYRIAVDGWNLQHGNIVLNWTLTTTTTYTLTVSASNGSVTKSPNQTSYAAGSTVTLTAVPNSGYTFSNWSGDASGTSNPVTIIMNGNKNVTASFSQIPTYTLTVSAANGSVTKSPNQTSYTAGTTVTLTAAANSGYTFSGWSGSVSGTSNPITITMNSNKSVTAAFTQNPTAYTLTVSASNGSVTKSPNQASYIAGSTVTLTAVPNSGYTFSGWSGSASGTTNPVTITMNSNKTVTAAFTQVPSNTYTLSLSAVNGSIIKSPDKTSYTASESVNLTAVPNSGYTFSGWSGDASGNNNPLTITMNANKTITASFTESVVTPLVTDLLGQAVYSKLENLSFDGVDDYVSVPTTGWNLTGTTVALWVNPSVVTGSHYVFGHTVGIWSNRIQLYIRDSILGVGLGNTHALNQAVYTCQAGQWYFIVLTWNGSSYQVYVDNQLRAQGTYEGLSQFNTFADLGNTGNSETKTSEPFFGTIDDVRIFGQALSSDQVAMVFNYGRNGCLTSHWRLDDYTAAATADSSENGYTAALVNDPVWGQSWADEDFVLLNAKNQALQIPSDAISAQTGTIATWISPASESGIQYLFSHIYNGSNRITLLTVNGKLAVSMGSQTLIQKNIAFLPYNQMVHIALAWNNGQYTIHMDGEQIASGSYTGLNELRSIFDVGNYGDPALRTVGFLGLIDEVRTYSRALAADEIKNLFQTYDVKENRQVAFIVSGVDEQGNPITYSASNLPEGAVFNTSSQSFSWRPWYRQAGEYNMTFDAQGQPSENVTVTVQEVTLQDWYREFLEANGKL